MNGDLLLDFTVDKENKTIYIGGNLTPVSALLGKRGRQPGCWINGGDHNAGNLNINL